ncbi:hypothetical protein ACCUM_1243 [Candidatus Accumulibacter phosphatis]|uniref:Uncharacterized protein n=1 Tax=Candidatus Accumulibacter phosphatis TaxID=327160 RepID=A0A5S4EJM3_9PROT|nr:hypothetical protein ACCUM_1243 [Candidatus Accumulibacter phosphatis]
MDVVFRDDQARTRTDHAAHNLAVLRQWVLNPPAHRARETQGRSSGAAPHRRNF